MVLREKPLHRRMLQANRYHAQRNTHVAENLGQHRVATTVKGEPSGLHSEFRQGFQHRFHEVFISIGKEVFVKISRLARQAVPLQVTFCGIDAI